MNPPPNCGWQRTSWPRFLHGMQEGVNNLHELHVELRSTAVRTIQLGWTCAIRKLCNRHSKLLHWAHHMAA